MSAPKRSSLRLKGKHINYCEVDDPIPADSLCYIPSVSSLEHSYVLVICRSTRDEYIVVELNPTVSSRFTLYTAECAVIKPNTSLPRPAIVHIVQRNELNSWAVLQVHYLSRWKAQYLSLPTAHDVWKSEMQQIKYNLAHSVWTSLNHQQWKRETALRRAEPISPNVYARMAYPELGSISNNVRKDGAYTYFENLDFKGLIKMMGIDSLRRTIEESMFFVAKVSFYYNTGNDKITFQYWIVRKVDGIIQTKAHAAKK